MMSAVGKNNWKPFWIYLVIILSACAHRSSIAVNSGGAQALLESSPAFRSIAVVDIESRDTIYRFSPPQVDSLNSALKKAFVSESLLFTPPPWRVALVIGSGNGPDFVALHYGDVLRVNSTNPWSTVIADTTGSIPAKGIADIVLNGDDVAWLFGVIGKAVGKPPSKSHRAPGILPVLHLQ